MDQINIRLLIRIEELIQRLGMDRLTATEVAMIEMGLSKGDVFPPPDPYEEKPRKQ